MPQLHFSCKIMYLCKISASNYHYIENGKFWPSNFIEIALRYGFSSANLLYIFRTPLDGCFYIWPQIILQLNCLMSVWGGGMSEEHIWLMLHKICQNIGFHWAVFSGILAYLCNENCESSWKTLTHLGDFFKSYWNHSIHL